MSSYLLLLFNIILLVTGQTLWKIGLQLVGGLNSKTVVQVLLSPYIWAGLVLYVIATVIWLLILSRLSLSIAYPLQSYAYVLGVLVAWLIFKESIPFTRWIGVCVVILGVYL
ncbi:MAG: hypothetical protein M0Z55_06895, partial [Peptococcaceae bacterium]|nr:hypothetical protein [Peptococcaceae bacterium]